MRRVPLYIYYKDLWLLLAIICILMIIQIWFAKKEGTCWKGYVIPILYSVYSIYKVREAGFLVLNEIQHRRQYMAVATYCFPGILLLMVYFIYYYYYKYTRRKAV